MRRRRSLLVGLGVGALAVALVRRRGRPVERVVRHLADGSTVTLAAGTAEGDRLLAAARAGVDAARGS